MMAFKAVDEFLRVQNWSSSDAKCWNIAVKFLMARKFDVDRAVKLYAEHDHLRKREGLDLINLNDDEFTRDLETGKFTILPFIKNYPVCALFTVRLHNGSSSSQNELTTLKTLIYQLDAALENPDAQRNGINFIYDMNNCKRSNYDLTLSQKILTLVRGSYPARLNKLFVVAAPFWFKCVVKVLFVSNEELKNQVPPEILPDYLGGHVKLNHKAWLIECNKLVTNKASTCSYYYHYSSSSKSSSSPPSDKTSTSMTTTTTTTTLTSVSLAVSNCDEMLLNTNRKRQQSSDFIDLDSNENGKKSSKKQISTTASPATTDMQENGSLNAQFILEKIEPLPFHNFYQSIHNVDLDDINGLTIDQLLQHVISTGAIGLSEEFKVIRSQPIMSSYEAFKHRENMYKNRYRDVICLDESRVLLKKEENGTELDEFDSDYIHANFVDGYKQKNAYISTQGPLDETVEDFWRMIWQQSVLVIAMTTKCYEQRKLKCAQYWPLEKGECMPIGDSFEITNLHISDLEDYRVTKLELRHVATNKTRTISHCQFMSWPDHGVPKSAAQILDFIGLVRANQAERLRELAQPWQGHPLGPPVCVHCSAGIGRTGTFCAIEISVNRLKDMRTVNILDTVNKIRAQRAQSVQMRDQYVFCYLAVIEYAQREKLLSDDNSKINLSCLFESLF